MCILQLLVTKCNNGDIAAASGEEDAPTVRDSVFNPNKTYCLG